MSDSDRVQVSYSIPEVTFGVHPAGTLKDLRLTSESLKQETSVVTSAEIRSDRQVTYVARTDLKASGGINTEVSYAAYDDLLEDGLLSAVWTTLITQTLTTFSMAVGDNSLNKTAGSFVTDGFLVNQWVKTSGFATAANNGFFKISVVAALKLTLVGGTVATEAAGPSVTLVQGARIKNGTTLKTRAIERRYVDLTSEFVIYTGMAVEQIGLNVALDQVLTGSFEFMGVKEASATASSGVGYTAAPTNDVMNAVDNIVALLENNVSLAQVTAFSFQLKNNLRARTQIGTLGAISLGTGKIDVTGSLQAYFNTKVLFDKYLNFTNTRLGLVAKDTAGNAYVVDFPKVKITSGQRVAGGQNQDIIADLNFSAFMDATETLTCSITRFAA